jgi:hypothetical protein
MEVVNLNEYANLLIEFKNEIFQRRSSNGIRCGTFNIWLSRKSIAPLKNDIPLNSVSGVSCVHQAYEIVVKSSNILECNSCKWCEMFNAESMKMNGKSKVDETLKISSCPYCTKNQKKT